MVYRGTRDFLAELSFLLWQTKSQEFLNEAFGVGSSLILVHLSINVFPLLISLAWVLQIATERRKLSQDPGKNIIKPQNHDSYFIKHTESLKCCCEAPWKLLAVFASLFTTLCLNELNLPPTLVEACPEWRLSNGSLRKL